MSIFLAAMLASAQPLPFIDRAEMDTLAKIEALQVRTGRLSRASAKAQLSSNMRLIGTVCGAASRLTDPAGFLAEIGSACGMSRAEASALRATCAVYMSGRLDAQRVAYRR